ncbi:MAG: hypothetical protein ABJ004_19365 [Cyclobacteriaceae bacterium]
MKRLLEKLTLVMFLGATIILTSCGDDEETTPQAGLPSISASLHVNGSASSSAMPGDSVSFSLTATAEGGINRIVALAGTTPILDKSYLDLGLTSGSTTSDVEGSISPRPSAADAGTTWEFSFVVVDDLNQVDTTTVSLDITSPEAKVQTAKLLYPPTGDGNSQTFYAIAQNKIYTHSEVIGTAEAVSPNIDLGYYYGGTDMATLSAISEYPEGVFDVSAWGTKNATKLIETSITLETYTALSTVADVEAEFENVDFSAQDGVTSLLAVGDVLAFETVAGLQGFIYVSDLEEGGDSNDYIELEFILAAAAE